jgi:hypothetical protein
MATPLRLADRITAIAGSVDLSGFTPFFSPLMFFLNENLWPTMTLMASLVAILLTTLVMVGWRQGRVPSGGTVRERNVTAKIGPVFRRGVTPARPATAVRLSLSIPGRAGFGWRPFVWNSRPLRGADCGRVHL